MNNKNLFPTVLKAEKPEIKVPVHSLPSEGPLSASEIAVFPP